MRPATEADLTAVQEVARAAGERFREVDDERVARCADDPPPERSELALLAEEGSLLVSDDERGALVGFVAVAAVDGRAHVEEVSVHPSVQGRGHGVALLGAVDEWASERELDAVTLTTFSDVPWNRPFYERRGFVVLDAGDIGPELGRVIDHEASLGLDPELRVAMWKPLA